MRQAKVSLISTSQAVPHMADMGCSGIGELVCYCARVSNPSGQFSQMNNQKLIDYLIRHQHWSPFEMVNVCMEINTTRDIARQILRHRSFSFQEFSQRYANPIQGGLGFSVREARLQDLTNRQNSLEIADECSLVDWFSEIQRDIIDYCETLYEQALEQGIAKEQARALLPEGLTNSRMYMSGSLRSWIHYVKLRSGPETQKEHREIALDCADILIELVPEIGGVLQDD